MRKDELPDECLVDIQEDSRDYYRNPLAWTANSEENFGFSDCTGTAEDAPEGNFFEKIVNNDCSFLKLSYNILNFRNFISSLFSKKNHLSMQAYKLYLVTNV